MKIFDVADREWALFVMANRNRSCEEYHHDYDILIGTVADDDMARLSGLYDMYIFSSIVVLASIRSQI